MNEKNLNKLFLDKKIFIIGFMAVGKTTIGKRIATKLGLPFYDSDKEIENKANMTIASFFETYGEEKFRTLEESVILEHVYSLTNKGFVMSLGGGSFINRKIREAILNSGISVWLNANIDIINLRVHNTKNTRPLLEKLDTKEKLMNLLQHLFEVSKLKFRQHLRFFLEIHRIFLTFL